VAEDPPLAPVITTIRRPDSVVCQSCDCPWRKLGNAWGRIVVAPFPTTATSMLYRNQMSSASEIREAMVLVRYHLGTADRIIAI